MAGMITLLIVLGFALYVCWLMLQPFFNVLLWAVVLSVVFYPMHRRIRERLNAPSMAAVCSTLLVVLFMALAPGEYWFRLASIINPSLDRFGSAQARSGLLQHSLISAVANPVFGLGLGNFPLTSARGQVTHNAYMQVASELGFAGAVVYTMFIVAPLKRLRLIERETFAARRASKFYYLAVGLQASLVAYMVSSFFVSVAFYLYIYYLVGYAVCLRRLYESEIGVLDEVRTPAVEAARAAAPSENYA